MNSLEIKPIWTDDDYELMGWHDCPIRGIAFLDDCDYVAGQFDSKLAFDIDYIFQWVLVETDKGQRYSFYVSPCTLVFEQAYDVTLNGSTVGYTPVFPQINCLTIKLNEESLKRNYRCYDVCIELHNSEPITLQSTGFKQYVRKPPFLVESQCLTITQRGGVCFGQTAIAELIRLPVPSASGQQTEEGG